MFVQGMFPTTTSSSPPLYGRYVIVPMTYRPQRQPFILEIASNRILEWDSDKNTTDIDNCKDDGALVKGSSFSSASVVSGTGEDWILEEVQRVDIEDDGRPLQRLHQEVAFLLQELGSVTADLRQMGRKIEELRQGESR